MTLDRSALLAQAAAPVLARLRSDRDRLCYPAREMLERLERYLFDSHFNVAEWLEECEVTSASAWAEIKRTVGVPLGDYLEELRIESAMRVMVLSGGALPVAEVGLLVGYESDGAFRSAFERRGRQTPGSYRQHVRELCRRGIKPPDPKWVRASWLARFAAGELEPSEAEAVFTNLEAVWELEPGSTSETAAIEDWEGFERWFVEAWWPLLRKLSVAERREEVLFGFRFTTPVVCEVLLQQSEKEGHSDPQLGVEVAELALDCLEVLRPQLTDAEHSQLLGNAQQRLAEARQRALETARDQPTSASPQSHPIGDTAGPAPATATPALSHSDLGSAQIPAHHHHRFVRG